MKFFNILLKFGETISDKIKKSVSNTANRKDGKIVSPSTSRFIFKKVAPILILLSIGIAWFFNGSGNDAASKFEEENKPKFSVAEPINTGATESDDVRFRTKETDGEIGGLTGFGSKGFSGVSSSGKNLNKFECREILAKVSRGETLDSDAKAKLDTCIELNTGGWTKDQLAAAKKSTDENLSPEARKALAGFANNDNPDPNDPVTKIAAGLISNDPARKEAAEKALANYNNLSKEDMDKLVKVASGEITGDEAQKILAGVGMPVYTAENNDKTNPVKDERANSQLGLGLGLPDFNTSPSALASEIKDKEAVLSAVNEKIDNLKNEVKADVSSGKDVPTAKIESINNNVAQKEKLEQEIEAKKILFKKIYKDQKTEILKAQNIASGKTGSIKTVSLEEDVPEFIPSKNKTRELTPDELRILDLLKKQQDNRKSIDISKYSDVKLEGDAAQLIVAGAKKELKLMIPPTVKILAVSETDILVSKDAASGFPIQARILIDIKNPVNGDKMIFKNAILQGKLTGVDIDTEMASAVFNKITIGADTLDVSLNVQIRGKVKDTRGKVITGALLTDFAAAVTDKIAKDAEDSVEKDDQTLADVFNIAGVTATTTGLQKVAQILAQDLANAKQIFYSPRNLPLVIHPN